MLNCQATQQVNNKTAIIQLNFMSKIYQSSKDFIVIHNIFRRKKNVRLIINDRIVYFQEAVH